MTQEKDSPAAFVFVCPVKFPITTEIQQLIPQPPQATTVHARSIPDAVKSIIASGRAVVVVTATEPKHLKIATTISARVRPLIKSGLVKIIILSSIHHDDLPKFLKKHGCEEMLPPNIKPKGLQLKLQRLFSSIERAWDKAGSQRVPAEEDAKSSPKPQPATAAQPDREESRKPSVKALAPLTIADDCWLIRGNAFKRVQGMWIVRVFGPSAQTGRWIKVAAQTDTWQWSPKDPNNPFVSQGTWTFYGRQPENRDKLWIFIGDTLRLTYSQNGKDICNRFAGGAKGPDQLEELHVARNSNAALSKESAMKASYEKDVRLKAPIGAEPEPTAQPAPEWSNAHLDAGQSEPIDSDFGSSEDKTPGVPPFSDGAFGNKTDTDPLRLAFYEEIMDELGPRPAKFNLITAERDCLGLMREAALVGASVTLWTRGQQFRKDTKASHFDSQNNMLGIFLPGGIGWPDLMWRFQELGAQDIFVNANLGRVAIFFKHPLNTILGRGATMEIPCPERIYEVQRRKDFRHPLKPEQEIQAQITLADGSVSSWKTVNVSAGGLALSCEIKSGGALPNVSKGSRIRTVRFKIYGREIVSAASIAWVKTRELPKSPVPKTEVEIGIRFEGLAPADREGIRLFVMEENYQYFSTGMARKTGKQPA